MAGITDLYIPTVVQSPFGNSLGQSGFVSPPGTPGISLDVFGDITQMLSLANLGVYSPWARREGAMDWDIVRQPPDTNITVFGLTDQLIEGARVASFGNPLPFVAVLAPVAAPRMPTMEESVAAFDGTPYELYETQAVYNQSDQAEPPRVMLLHWAKIRDQGDTGGGTGSLEAAAQRLGGNLVFAMQVNYDTSSLREPPTTSFEDALSTQMGVLPAPEPGVTPPPLLPGEQPPAPAPDEPYPPPGAAAKAEFPWLPVIGAGLVAGVTGFLIVRSARAKKGR